MGVGNHHLRPLTSGYPVHLVLANQNRCVHWLISILGIFQQMRRPAFLKTILTKTKYTEVQFTL